MFKKLKKNKKGFTLVEIIVVLVILAILAAIAIPTMLGFVNDAKGKAYIAEARTAYVAAQAIATEKKNSGGTYTVPTSAEVNKLASLTLDSTKNETIEVTDEGSDGIIDKVALIKGGKKVTITVTGANQGTVVEDAA